MYIFLAILHKPCTNTLSITTD